MTDGIGLYVHIPFCKSKCNYCDFCSYPKMTEECVNKYIDCLQKEMSFYKQEERIKVSTLYFGGGTPSLLNENQLLRIVKSLSDIFTFTDDLEFTLEANPGTLTREKVEFYKDVHINRISMGLQSIHQNELKKLGRIHDFAQFEKSYTMVKDAGIDNINVDLMYGIPYQTKQSYIESLATLISFQPKHISAYSLIVEENTPFFRDFKSLVLPSEDEVVSMYYDGIDLLNRYGYNHYEISNYAKDNFESKHNLKYWRDESYIGLGVSAHSYFRGVRYSNVSNINEYFNSCVPNYKHGEVIDKQNEMFEYAMMRLRLKEGFSLSDYKAKFDVDFLFKNREKIKKYIELDLMKIENDRLHFTDKGFFVSNTILSSIL